MKNKSFFAAFIFIIIAGIGLLWARYVYHPINVLQSTVIVVVSVVIALTVSSAIRIADPWDKTVVLRLAHFRSLKEPALFFIVPIIGTIPLKKLCRSTEDILHTFFNSKHQQYDNTGK